MSKNKTKIKTTPGFGENSYFWILVIFVLVFGWLWEFYPNVKMGFFDNKPSVEAEEMVVREKKIEFWKNLITKQPSYHRAYLELAMLSAESGEIIDAKMYLGYALAIDPNNDDNLSVEKYLESKEMFMRN